MHFVKITFYKLNITVISMQTTYKNKVKYLQEKTTNNLFKNNVDKKNIALENIHK